MTFRNAVRVTLVLAATAALGQSSQPGATPSGKRQSQTEPRGPAGETATDPLGVGAIHEQVTEMESTLSRMDEVLKQTKARAAEGKSSDSLSKTNLEMWELMVGHLEKELQQLRVSLAEREDMERRRAALYKQADAKIQAANQAARAAQAARFAEAQKKASGTVTTTMTPAEQPGQPSAASPTAPPPSSVAQPASKSGSPN